ncbi:hypothetical protein QOZ80_3AG0222680 [Eleusine coracana subsp. coracana]|nr:hypothetical protein QOZ80_3AG0222680 [Eleusine coracana subsp. coracana]
MSNSKRMEQLGVTYAASELNRYMGAKKNKRPRSNSEDSGSDYDPTLDDSVGDLMDVESAKETSNKGSKKANTQTSYVLAGAIKFQSRKRVFAQPSTICSRSKQSKPQPNASLTASDLHAVIQDAGISLHDENTNMTTKADISLHDENTNVTIGADISLHNENNNMDAIARLDGHNHMANEDGFVQQDDYTTMAEGADGIL